MSVANPSSAVQAMQPDWDLAAALLGGTTAMRDAGVKFLPKWPAEDGESYEARRKTAVLFPAYQRTVQTLTGKPFSKAVTVGDDVPPQIVEWLEDIDMEGRNIDSFGADLLECALGYGLCGILVDYPKAEGVRTVADERIQGLRPYWVHIKPHQILGWQARRINGAWVILELRLMETVAEQGAEFEEMMVPQVRVLRPGYWATYRKPEKSSEWVLFDEGVNTLDRVPFVPVYGSRTGFMTAKPPLIGMAHMNVEHWQSASDQQTIMHVARVPILAVIGVDDDTWQLTVGAKNAVKVPQGADIKYVEHSGAAIAAGRESLIDLEERMRQAGAELLVLDGKLTATQVSTENAVGMCALQRITADLEDALDQALQLTADYAKLPEGGHVQIFNGYATIAPIGTEAAGIIAAVQAGLISKATAINEMKRRGILSAEVEAELEAAAIESEGPRLGDL